MPLISCDSFLTRFSICTPKIMCYGHHINFSKWHALSGFSASRETKGKGGGRGKESRGRLETIEAYEEE